MLSQQQQRLVSKALSLGFGYASFASNVQKQGFCTTAQEQALRRMIAAGEFRKNNWKTPMGRIRPLAYKHTISDSEAMQSGDFF